VAKICWQILIAILAKENLNKSSKNNKNKRNSKEKGII